MKKTLKTLFILASIFFGLLGIVIFDVIGGPIIIRDLYKNKQPELEFSFSRCSSDVYGTNEVVSERWNDDELIVEAKAYTNCAATWLFGEYRIEGDSIVLGYRPIMPGLMACECGFDVSYKIYDLPRGKYALYVKEIDGQLFESFFNSFLMQLLVGEKT